MKLQTKIVGVLAFELIALIAFSNLASAELSTVFKNSLGKTVSDLVENPELYARAVRLLDCGESLPATANPADLILYYAYGRPEEDELNSTTTHRLEKVSSLYANHLGRKIIVTGNGFPEKNLAKNGAKFLMERGVSLDKIIMDDTSTTTWLNLIHGIKIFENEGAKSAIFVSSPYHINRIMGMYEALTLANKESSPKIKVYWTSYDHQRDDIDPINKMNQVYVEIHQSIANHLLYNVPLRSNHCRDYDRAVGRQGQFEAFLEDILDQTLALAEALSEGLK